jgi:hypothetical protein
MPPVRVLPETWLSAVAMSRVPLATSTVPVLLRVVVAMVLVPVPPVSSGVLSFRRRADGLRLEFFHIGKRLVRVG